MEQPQCRHNLLFTSEEQAEKASTWVMDHIDLTDFYDRVNCFLQKGANALAPFECVFYTQNFLQQDTVDRIEQECEPEMANFNLDPDPLAPNDHEKGKFQLLYTPEMVTHQTCRICMDGRFFACFVTVCVLLCQSTTDLKRKGAEKPRCQNQGLAGECYMITWEYTIVRMSTPPGVPLKLDEVQLQDLGAQGWELVNAIPIESHSRGLGGKLMIPGSLYLNTCDFVFKRANALPGTTA